MPTMKDKPLQSDSEESVADLSSDVSNELDIKRLQKKLRVPKQL